MNKTKVYFDTSVISYLDQQDAPELMFQTHKFWDVVKTGKFSVIISEITEFEINNCQELKRAKLRDYLDQIDYSVVTIDEETESVAQKFVDMGILGEKHLQDRLHLAAAIVNGCSIVVSWNFKHMVKHKTIMGAKAIAAFGNYGDIWIYPPASLLNEEE